MTIENDLDTQLRRNGRCLKDNQQILDDQAQAVELRAWRERHAETGDGCTSLIALLVLAGTMGTVVTWLI